MGVRLLVLRAYQSAAIENAQALMRRGVKRLIVTMPCGAGKTVLVAQMIAQAVAKGKRAWFLVHRVELLRQSVETFTEAADVHTGIVAAGFPDTPLAPVQVCSIQSLGRRMARLTPPDLLVFDECHHQAAATWAKIAQTFPAAYQIGLTATPQRLDGRGLRTWFDSLVCGPSTADLIAQGFLSPYKLYAPTEAGPNLDGVGTVAGDYNKAQLADAMERSTVVGDALSHYQQFCPAARALVFVWSIKASKALAARFAEAGIPTAHIDGDTPHAEREANMQRFRDGELRVICNVDLFGEGLDVPALDAVFLLRPTASLGLYLQQIGRGLRPSAGKEFVRVFDHAGNWRRFGLPDDERAWSLDAKKKRAAKTAPPGLRRCKVCFAVSRISALTCSACGRPFEVTPRRVQQVSGTLAEWRQMSHTPTVSPTGRRSLWEWQQDAKRRGYKPGWAYYRWKEQRMRA